MSTSDIRGDGEQLEALCGAIIALGDPTIRRAVGRLSRALRGRPRQDDHRRLILTVARAGNGGIGRSGLLRAFRHLDRNGLTSLLRIVLQGGMVEAFESPSRRGGLSRRRYRLRQAGEETP
jgi:hypothetical protein